MTIKKIQETLELTIPELAELIGGSEGTVRNWSSTGNIPQWAINSINAQIELKELKEAQSVKLIEDFKELEQLREFKKQFKTFLAMSI